MIAGKFSAICWAVARLLVLAEGRGPALDAVHLGLHARTDRVGLGHAADGDASASAWPLSRVAVACASAWTFVAFAAASACSVVWAAAASAWSRTSCASASA